MVVATVLANPNWPVMGFEVDFQSGPPNTPGAKRKSIDAAYRRLAVRRWDTTRGRQYELDQVQVGVLNMDVHDPLEYLNTDNPTTPYDTGGNQIIPYRAIWVWAMWPNQPGSGNIINPGVNIFYDPSFELNPGGGLGLWGVAGGATTRVQSTAQTFNGSKSLLVTQSATGVGFGVFNSFRTAPILTYTFSVYVFPTGGATVNLTVVDAAGGTQTVSSTTTSAWQRLSITWNCVDALETVTIYGTGVSTPTFYVDATQLEYGSTATAFTTTGPTLYTVYSGYVERWPTDYGRDGLLATRKISAVDALAILSRTAITQTYNSVIAADTPAIFVPMSNLKQPITGGALSLGSETGVVGASSITGNPYYTISPTGSLNWAGDHQLDGTPAVVITQQNSSNPPVVGGLNQDCSIDVYNTSLSINTTTGGMVEFWAKVTAGTVSLGGIFAIAPGGSTIFVNGIPQIVVQSLGNGQLGALYSPDGINDVLTYVSPGGGYSDGVWHYFALTVVSGTLTVTYDNTSLTYVAVTPGSIGFNVLCHASADCPYREPQSQVSFGRWAVYQTNIGSTRRLAHYNRGVGYINEISGARVLRLLTTWWQGGTKVSSGYLAMAPDFTYNTRVVLDVLQEIQESERGLMYADVTNVVVFEDRTTRYANQVPLRVFGENPAGASPVEFPYSRYVPENDPTYTFSQANLTRPANSGFAPAVNTTTQNNYGQRILAQTMQCNTDFDLTQAGIFYLQRYSTTKTRISALVLNPAANPALWPVVLALELSQLHTVTRRNAGLTLTNNFYIENIKHKVDSDAGTWETTLQLSPQFNPVAWVLGDTTYGVLGTTSVPVY